MGTAHTRVRVCRLAARESSFVGRAAASSRARAARHETARRSPRALTALTTPPHPPGQKVKDGDNNAWPGVGHTARGGGGARNAFGAAFAAAGRKWTKALCEADSDGDGLSNGVELGERRGRFTLPYSQPRPAWCRPNILVLV